MVSAFSMLGDILRPKSFAGLFGAAPAVALATLGDHRVHRHGADYAAQQTWAMTAGQIKLFAKSMAVVCFVQLLIRARLRAAPRQRSCRSSSDMIVAFGLFTLAGAQT